MDPNKIRTAAESVVKAEAKNQVKSMLNSIIL